MNRWILLVIGLCLIAGCGVRPATPRGDLNAFTAQLDNQMPQWLQQYQVPGVAVALVRKGEVVWAKGYGLADKELGVPITADTVFQMASISKSVATWGVLRLVEKGKLALDAPVEQYLTRWHLPPSSHPAQGVTIRRLLSHSAGLSLSGYPGLPPGQPLPSLEESLSGKNGGAGDVRLTMEPGTQYSYSGGGYTLLQLLVEEVTGENFQAYMQREVLIPLGMTHSSYDWRADLQPATAIGYNSQGQPLPNYLFTERAAAGLYATAPDLARFVAAEMTGPAGEPAGRGLITPKTITLMFAPVAQIKGLDAWLGGEAVGLGHFVGALPDGSQIVGHGGSNQGWKLQFRALPEKREGIVILTNSDRGEVLFVDALGAWGQWLGTGAPKTSRVFQGLRRIVLGLACLLFLGLVLRLGHFLRQYRAGRRQLVWRIPTPLTRWQYAGLTLSILLAASLGAFWWLLAHPILIWLVPNQVNWLTLAVLGWCLCWVFSALLRCVAVKQQRL